jgi:hypothetical protein
LEDVSELFLSHAACDAGTGVEAEGHAAGKIHPLPAEPAIATLLRPFQAVTRDRLVSLLGDQPAILEEGVRTLDLNVACDPCGPIDLLAADGANHLVAIDLDDSPSDAVLLRAVAHFDWLVRNVSILRRMYRGHVIDFSSDPRLFLVAPDYSPLLRCAARGIARPQIICFRYRAVALRNGAGVLVERA